MVSFHKTFGVLKRFAKGFVAGPTPGSMSDNQWTATEAMAKLKAALDEKEMTVDELFRKFDADNDGTINGPELHHGIRDVVGDILSPGQISQIITAFDANTDHRIDLAELQSAFSEEE